MIFCKSKDFLNSMIGVSIFYKKKLIYIYIYIEKLKKYVNSNFIKSIIRKTREEKSSIIFVFDAQVL